MAASVPRHRRRMVRTARAASTALALTIPLSMTGGSQREWHIQASPNPGSFSNLLLGASALSGRDIWAVGNASPGAGQQALAEHWDGAAWTAVATPFLPGGGSFSGVAGASSCDVWAVGDTGNATTGAELPLIEHWDCTRWSVVPSPAVPARFAGLNSVATGPAGTWAVGDSQTVHGPSRPLVERLVHQQWHVVASPQVGAGASLRGVAVGSDGTVWAAGAFIDPASGKARTLIERFREGHWTVIPGPNHGPGDNVLSSVAVPALPKTAVSAASKRAVQVAAVGSWVSPDLKTFGPLIATWDGSRWRELPNHLLPSAPFSSAQLLGVAITGKGDVLAAGWVAADGPARTLIAVAHNGRVRQVPSPSRPPFDNELFGVATAADGTAVVVGFNAATGGFEQTLIEATG